MQTRCKSGLRLFVPGNSVAKVTLKHFLNFTTFRPFTTGEHHLQWFEFAECSPLKTSCDHTGAALPENNEGATELTTANGASVYFELSQTR